MSCPVPVEALNQPRVVVKSRSVTTGSTYMVRPMVRPVVRPALPSEGENTAGSVAHVYPASDSGALELPGRDGFRTRPASYFPGLEDPGTSPGSGRVGPTCLPSLQFHSRNPGDPYAESVFLPACQTGQEMAGSLSSVHVARQTHRQTSLT